MKWLVSHSTTMLLAALAIVTFGMISYANLPREAAPDIDIPVVMVTTPYIGVSPEDIEGLISIPIENELSSLRDVKKLTSVSAEGIGIVYIEFEPDVVMEDGLQKVRDRVNRAKPKLPADAEEPEIREISFSDFPILIVTLAGGLDEEGLKGLAEALEDKIGRINGVLDTKIGGGLDRQVRVQVDPVRIAHFGFKIGDVSNALRDENVNIPGGEVLTGGGNVLVRVPGEFETAAEIGGVAVKRYGDRPVFVRDIARVVDGYEDRESYARMNGRDAVSVSVTKRPGSNMVEIADAIKVLVEDEAQTWPEGVEHRVLADQSTIVRDMVSELQNNIGTALILVVGVVLFFMGFRNSLFIAVSIPLSMLLGFMVIEALGFTLNMIVLFSLILALGMLVDNAIVIVENIYRHHEEGSDLVTASVEGTREVGIAVAASTATTVAAFFPMVFWTGIMGEFMGYLPKTLIITLTSSLVVAVAILPVMTSLLMRLAGKSAAKRDQELADTPQTGIMGRYVKALEWSIDHRWLAAFAGFATLILTFVAYGALNHGTEFFPATDPERATIAISAPGGTDLETTDRLSRIVEAIVAQEENVDVMVAEVGLAGGGAGDMTGGQPSPTNAKVTIDFLPDRNRAKPGQKVRIEPTPETINRLRDRLAEVPGADIEIQKEEMGPPVGPPIAVEISGEDFHVVGEAAKSFQRALEGVAGVTDLANDYKVGRPELRLRVDRGAAKRAGLSTSAIGNAVRTAIAGQAVTTIRDGETEIDVVVELDPRAKNDLQSVLGLRLPGREDTSPDTFAVPLSAVASYDLVGGSGAISHIDQDLVVTVTGNIAEGMNPNAVRADVQALIADYDSPEGTHVRLGGADDEQRNAQEFLSRAFLIAIALIMMVLVSQFDSITIPFIILASVILSLVGVLWGLVLTGTPFGIMMTGIGVISLAGVVVNNAIVLLDYVQQLRATGLPVRESLIRAGVVRFRPVMLTAITTILGLVPMAIGVSFDFVKFAPIVGGSTSQFWKPMAVAVIFGLAFATVLTLVMVPTFYSLVEDMKERAARLRRRLPMSGAAAAAKLALLGLGAGLATPAQALTLDDALRAAEANSVELMLAEESTIQAESYRGQAWSLVGPKLQANASYTINDKEIALDFMEDFSANIPDEFASFFDDVESEPTVIQEKEFAQWSVSVVQPLASFSALPTLRGAYALTDAARADASWQRSQLLAGVTGAYYGVLAARMGVDVATEAVELATGQLDLAQRQVAAGLQPRRAEVQAQLGLAQAERELAAARESAVSAEEGLARLTGLEPGQPLELPTPPAAPASSLDDALSTARTARPDLAAAYARVRIAEFSVRANWGGLLPKADARFTYAYSGNTGFSDDPTLWMVVGEARWTFWDGGYAIAKNKELASQRRSAELAARLALEQMEESLRTAWHSAAAAEAALSAVEREQELAAENLELAQRAFEAGSATWLEVNQATLAQRAAELSGIVSRMERDLAIVDLQVQMGAY